MRHDITIKLSINDVNEHENRTEMKALATGKRLKEIVTNVSKETFPNITEWNITMKWKDIDLASRLLNQLNSENPVVVTMNDMREADKNDIINDTSFLEVLKDRIDKDNSLKEDWPGFKVTNITDPKARATKGTLDLIYFVILIILLIYMDFYSF